MCLMFDTISVSKMVFITLTCFLGALFVASAAPTDISSDASKGPHLFVVPSFTSWLKFPSYDFVPVHYFNPITHAMNYFQTPTSLSGPDNSKRTGPTRSGSSKSKVSSAETSYKLHDQRFNVI